MFRDPEEVPGYTYGTAAVGTSPVSLEELEQRKVSVGFTAEDERSLRKAGERLEGQTKQIVQHWRSGIIAGIPNLARHSRTPDEKLGSKADATHHDLSPLPAFLDSLRYRTASRLRSSRRESLRPRSSRRILEISHPQAKAKRKKLFLRLPIISQKSVS